ncbi:hypothetical protein NE237_002259 [Protea cynaroides]|uniref:Uncharacterized protein n=1 Tax=Protea cynaroides TaxID=273540 RepID=A0A9Q0KUN2_9MAGN|nr:hypothetical protein NE237_002259 [Protea cynaroides]
MESSLTSQSPQQDLHLHQPLLSKEQQGNDQLESILSDEQLPWFNRFSLATFIELKMLFYLAAPVVIMYIINFLIVISTQIFCGHLGNLELAAANLGNTGAQMFTYGLMVSSIN